MLFTTLCLNVLLLGTIWRQPKSQNWFNPDYNTSVLYHTDGMCVHKGTRIPHIPIHTDLCALTHMHTRADAHVCAHTHACLWALKTKYQDCVSLQVPNSILSTQRYFISPPIILSFQTLEIRVETLTYVFDLKTQIFQKQWNKKGTSQLLARREKKDLTARAQHLPWWIIIQSEMGSNSLHLKFL